MRNTRSKVAKRVTRGNPATKSVPLARTLRTTPIAPHQFPPGEPPPRFGKTSRTLGNPIADPKRYARFIPPPSTNLVNLSLDMSVVLPEEAATVRDSGKLVFHAVGDTGGIHGDDVEKAISETMELQVSNPKKGETVPSFFYNLGDVVYYNGENNLYGSQFYEPYQNYHQAIFAIAGNHDGDTKTRAGDPVDTEPTLFGFMRNFCDSVSQHESPYRPTQTQPYVYWTFVTPIATIIGLYSNVDGTLDARGTNEQQKWFEDQVQSSDPNNPLIIAVHHPPFSLDTTHGGYPDIGISIDRVIQSTQRKPTIVLSGHVHSYQRFERTLESTNIPYIISGAGGYANTTRLMHKIEQDNGRPLPEGFQTTLPDVKLMAFEDQQPGFLRISVDSDKKELTSEYFTVPFDQGPTQLRDSVTAGW